MRPSRALCLAACALALSWSAGCRASAPRDSLERAADPDSVCEVVGISLCKVDGALSAVVVRARLGDGAAWEFRADVASGIVEDRPSEGPLREEGGDRVILVEGDDPSRATAADLRRATLARLDRTPDGVVAVSIHLAPAGGRALRSGAADLGPAAARISLRPQRDGGARRELVEGGRALGAVLVRGLGTWVFLR